MSCFQNQLEALIKLLSHLRIYASRKVMRTVSPNITTKNMTAQGVCRGPVSFESIVPIVMVNVKIENCAR